MFCICFVIIWASLPRQGSVSICEMSLGGSLSTWPEACGAVATREGEGTACDLPAAIPSAPHSRLCYRKLEGFFGGRGRDWSTVYRRHGQGRGETNSHGRAKYTELQAAQNTLWLGGSRWRLTSGASVSPKPQDAFVSVAKIMLEEMAPKA